MPSRRLIVVAGVSAVFAATGIVAYLRKPPPKVVVDALPSASVASDAPPLMSALPPRNRNYQRGAYFTIREGLTRAASAHRRGDDAEALRILTDDDLALRAGVILERYPASSVGGPPGSLTPEAAAVLAHNAFDETYAIGKTGQRGILVGRPNVDAKVFARPEDLRRWSTATVLAAMVAWIAVWEDVAGNRAVSTSTLEAVRERRDATGWASMDAYAVLRDLDVTVPPELLADPRFPGWAPMAAWRTARESRDRPDAGPTR